MKKRIYKLKNDFKYENSNKDTFMQHMNRAKVQKALIERKELLKKYRKRYKKPSILWLVAFYYGFIALILLFKKLGF